jgi:hypothetical protein
MTLVDTQWALKSILQLSHHQLRASTVTPSMSCATTSCSAIRVSATPRLMQATNGSRVLLLARRPNGIAGVEVGYGGRVPWVATGPLTDNDTKPSKKVRRLASYLQRRGFETVPTAPRLLAVPRTPLLLHANHFIGWKLSRSVPAFPLYAHTLDELQQLRGKEMAALQPRDCLVLEAYSEWDNWREVLCEPGWDFFNASDDAVERMVRDGITAPFVDEEDGVCKVELS